MTEARFLLLRGTFGGPVYLARLDQPDDADTWTEARDDARRFDDRAEADAERDEIMSRGTVSVAVVPDLV